MKKLLLIIVEIALFAPLYGQTSLNNQSRFQSLESRLVELAMQNPEIEIADHQIQISKYQLKEAKGWWLNNISLSLNANEFTVKRLQNKTVEGKSYPYYPLYNVGINIPIGGIFSKPAAVKAAREHLAISQASRNSKYRQLRAEVLSAYQDYKTNKELYALQSQITEAAYNEYLQAKEQFRNGQISLDDFNNISGNYHQALKNRIGAKYDFEITKINLEELIGKPIGQVMTSDVERPGDTESQENDH